MAMIEGGVLPSPEVGDKEILFYQNAFLKSDKLLEHGAPDPTYWPSGWILIPKANGVTKIIIKFKNLKRIGLVYSKDRVSNNAGTIKININGVLDKYINDPGNTGLEIKYLGYVNNFINQNYTTLELEINPTGNLGFALEGLYVNDDAELIDANIVPTYYIKTSEGYGVFEGGNFVTKSPTSTDEWKNGGIKDISSLTAETTKENLTYTKQDNVQSFSFVDLKKANGVTIIV